MALGAYDSNGIWKYGESDNIALFSDTLNKLANSTSSAFTSDRARIGTLEAGSLSGLIPITTGTVTGAGGTVTTNGLGTVTFTTCTSITLDNFFTSTYSNYKLIFDSVNSVSLPDVTAQFRAAGVTLTASNYNSGYSYYSSGAGVWANTSTTAAANMLFLTQAGSATSQRNMIEIDVITPASPATQTQIGGISMRGRNNGIMSGSYGVAAATDGLYLLCSAGNMSGKLTVYGWNQ